MNDSILSVRVDEESKREFEKFCNKVGMNISTAINMLMKNVVYKQKMPFEPEPFDEEVMRKLEEAEDDFKNGRYYTEEEFNEFLDSLMK